MSIHFRLIAALAFLAATPVWAAYETAARAAYVLDVGTGTVLFEKNADVPLPPASMSKLMTLNMLFEALRDGRVSMETEFGISNKAHTMGGSKMFLRDGGRVAVRELIPGIIVQSGNDACIVVAEGLAGTEDAFVRVMNQRAKALGMTGSNFANASGWPHPTHRMSVRDLAFLGARIRC
jgi:D-alanyl-D-alanine carboxypeptidase (penicillin-binding protein 5/6)